jgi:Ca-activated chloride channel family protein
MSVLFHGSLGLMLFMLSRMEGCQPDYSGERGEGFRAVGVYLTDGETEDEPAEQSEEPALDQLTRVADAAAQTVPRVLDAPPALDLPLPTLEAPPVLGIGGQPPLSGVPAPGPTLGTPAMAGPAPSPGTARGGATSLFGITDAGRRFLYVMDRSGSMSDYGAIRVAKAELLASLENLDATQEFQVIFYNSTPIALVPRTPHSDMFRGIDTHRLEVRRQVESIQPDGGTGHLDALRSAFKFRPDVIFFLTDAAEPQLSSSELDEVRRGNVSGARIHCIEFGEGPKTPGRPNFLETLARQHDGQYQYRDVRRLGGTDR